MNKEYPKYQLIDTSKEYLTYRKYLDEINYEDIDIKISEIFDSKQALTEVKEICNYYGITKEENDNVVLRNTLKNISRIIDKVGGNE